MKSITALLSVGVLALFRSQTVLALPAPQGLGKASALISNYNAAPAPTVPIGGSGNFVTIDKATKLFNLGGKPQYFSGTNTWWLAFNYDNADVDKVLRELVDSKLPVTRVWAFGNTNDSATGIPIFFQELKDGKQKLNFDPNTGIPKLDYVVSKAEELNIKLIMPLLNGNDDLGGIQAYVNNYGGRKETFYTDASSQAAYLAYVDFIVNRYKDSPAVFSWELCNEPRCHNCPLSTITNWAASVSKHIKELDSKHLVSLGDEGWFAPPQIAPNSANTYPYQGAEGINFTANLNIPDIDFGTFHMYPEQWDETDNWGNDYIREHAAIGKALGKPILLEEYGSTKGNKVEIMQKWQKTIRDEGLAADTFWQFKETLAKGNKPFDDYGLQYSTEEGSEYVEIVVKHAKAMKKKVVGGS